MPGRHDPGKIVVGHRPLRNDPAGNARRADRSHPGGDVRTQILQEHVVVERFTRHVSARVSMDIDQAGDQPATLVDQLRPGHRFERDAVAVHEHHTLDAVGQAPTTHAHGHLPTPDTEPRPRQMTTDVTLTSDLHSLR